MRIAIVMLVLGVSCGVALSGCGGDSPEVEVTGSTTAQGVPDSDGNTPFEVLRRAVTAANACDFNGAKSWVLPNSVMGTNDAGIDVLPQKWPPFTRNGQIATIDFISDDYTGQDVTVKYKLTFKDGSTFKEQASLTKHEGRWKLTFMTAEAMF